MNDEPIDEIIAIETTRDRRNEQTDENGPTCRSNLQLSRLAGSIRPRNRKQLCAISTGVKSTDKRRCTHGRYRYSRSRISRDTRVAINVNTIQVEKKKSASSVSMTTVGTGNNKRRTETTPRSRRLRARLY